MNIAYVLADFPVFSETFVGDEMRAMQARGHTLVPIVLRAQTVAGQDADQELAALAYRLPNISSPTALSLLKHSRLRLMDSASLIRRQSLLPSKSLAWNALKIAAVAKRHGCTHLHAHFAGGAAAHAITAARLIGASVSFICHGHDVYSEPEDLTAKLNAADFVIATCEDMAADLREMAPSAKIVRSYCGIDPGMFPLREKAQHNGKLLFIGRLVEQKGVEDIFEALAGMPAEKRPALDIVGDGPLRAALEVSARAKKLLPGCVAFLGQKPRTWFSENGANYAALVAPFKTGPNGERDSGPTVIKEAMAMGLPVISSRYMGVKEMVAPGTGLLIEPGDAVALSRAIETVCNWPAAERAAIIDAAHSHICSNFTLENQAAELSSFISAAREKGGCKSSQVSRNFIPNSLGTFCSLQPLGPNACGSHGLPRFCMIG